MILIRSLSGSEPTIIWRSHFNISKMVLYCRQVGVWCRTGYSSMGPLCGLRLGQNASLTLNKNTQQQQAGSLTFIFLGFDVATLHLCGRGMNFIKLERVGKSWKRRDQYFFVIKKKLSSAWFVLLSLINIKRNLQLLLLA